MTKRQGLNPVERIIETLGGRVAHAARVAHTSRKVMYDARRLGAINKARIVLRLAEETEPDNLAARWRLAWDLCDKSGDDAY